MTSIYWTYLMYTAMTAWEQTILKVSFSNKQNYTGIITFLASDLNYHHTDGQATYILALGATCYQYTTD